MLYNLIRQELLAHLISARFFAAIVTTLLLVVTNTFVLIGAYEERVADYSQKKTLNAQDSSETPTYSYLKLKVHRTPTPLSLFSAGLETRFGSDIRILFDTVPSLSSPKVPLGLKNPYLSLFSHIDLVFIFQVVLSLLSLLFAYDAIAGGRETGILRLVLSHPVGRGSVLLAKYIAAMICLLLPVFMSLILALIQCSLANFLELRTDDFLRIGGIVLTTIVYLSVFYLIGLVISAATRRSSTSLMICLFLWVLLVMVYPNWSRFALNSASETYAEKISAEREIQQIWEAADREERQYLNSSPLLGKPPLFKKLFGNVTRELGQFYRIQGELNNAADPLVRHLQHFHEFAAALRIRCAERAGLVHQQYLNETALHQAKQDERFMKLSPASLYTFATAAWAGTDLDTMTDYINEAQAYRHNLIDYFHDKDVFGSLQWFATNQGAIDWSGLPRFRFQRAGLDVNAYRALPELFLLLLMNIVLFMSTFLIFIKIEV